MAGKVSKWTPEKVTQLEQLRAEGLPRKVIAEKMGVTFDSLKCQLDRMVRPETEDGEEDFDAMVRRGTAALADKLAAANINYGAQR